MKRIVFLNTSILTDYGVFEYRPATVDEIKKLITSETDNGAMTLSSVGHEATAQTITMLLNYPVSVNRIQYRQEPDDIAVVFKLRGRPMEGQILGMDEIEAIGYDFGILRIKEMAT